MKWQLSRSYLNRIATLKKEHAFSLDLQTCSGEIVIFWNSLVNSKNLRFTFPWRDLPKLFTHADLPVDIWLRKQPFDSRQFFSLPTPETETSSKPVLLFSPAGWIENSWYDGWLFLWNKAGIPLAGLGPGSPGIIEIPEHRFKDTLESHPDTCTDDPSPVRNQLASAISAMESCVQDFPEVGLNIPMPSSPTLNEVSRMALLRIARPCQPIFADCKDSEPPDRHLKLLIRTLGMGVRARQTLVDWKNLDLLAATKGLGDLSSPDFLKALNGPGQILAPSLSELAPDLWKKIKR